MTALSVRLGTDEVGVLELVGGEARFSITEAHRKRYPRATLGQVFLEDPSRVHVGKAGRLPNWFSHLLPEGALRETVERRVLSKNRRHELYLLDALGHDLPGAVRVRREGVWPTSEPDDEEPPEPDEEGLRITFSIAGVQPKFSVLQRAKGGLTVAAEDEEGPWILKVPSRGMARLAECEYAGMVWAKEAGLHVASVELCETNECRGIPSDLAEASPRALKVRRFDRSDNGVRVHAEDFAQVLDRPPGDLDKYAGASYEQIASVVLGVTGNATQILELIDRIVFMAFLGNEDMHLKNLGLLYENGGHADLSPAYDLVPTLLFTRSEGFALKLAGSAHWRDLRRASFAAFADVLGVTRDVIDEGIASMAARSREAWTRLRNDLPLTEDERRAIEAHWKEVPLLREV